MSENKNKCKEIYARTTCSQTSLIIILTLLSKTQKCKEVYVMEETVKIMIRELISVRIIRIILDLVGDTQGERDVC